MGKLIVAVHALDGVSQAENGCHVVAGLGPEFLVEIDAVAVV